MFRPPLECMGPAIWTTALGLRSARSLMPVASFRINFTKLVEVAGNIENERVVVIDNEDHDAPSGARQDQNRLLTGAGAGDASRCSSVKRLRFVLWSSSWARANFNLD